MIKKENNILKTKICIHGAYIWNIFENLTNGFNKIGQLSFVIVILFLKNFIEYLMLYLVSMNRLIRIVSDVPKAIC